MVKIRLRLMVSGFGLLLFFLPSLLADNTLLETAAKYHTDQKWADSIKAYSQFLSDADVADAATNERAWYRIAHAYIQLNQGEHALKANENLADALQISQAVVLYQKAQAQNLMGSHHSMWPTLEQMTIAGYTNLNELKNNPMWQKFQDQEQFKSLLQQIDKNVRPCMFDERFRQFDFWLGRWEVYGNLDKTGPLYGHNTITSTEQGCLIMEQWKGASGSSGTSMNYYDGILKQWVQRWVSGGGIVIDYTGGLIEQPENKPAMQLVGKIYYASIQQLPKIRDFRGTWTPLDKGVVQQFFEESVDGGKTWYPWFNGFYFPMAVEIKNEE